MKLFLTVLLCLLLGGCSPKPDTLPPETAPETQSPPEITGLYAPGHPMEQAYPGAVRAYPLPQQALGLLPLGSDVLLLSGETNTVLTLLTGEDLYEKARLTLGFDLQWEDPSLQIHMDGISFFDPRSRETILLDHQLQELRRIAVPQEASGKPILSSDTRTLYYCTDWSVMAWDLESGIRRTVKELSYSSQVLTALHQNDQVLECTITDEGNTYLLLLRSDNGAELGELPEQAQLETGDQGFFASYPQGFQTMMLSGSDSLPELLLPRQHPDQQFYLPEDHAVVTAAPLEEGLCLDYYELNTGILRSSLVLEKTQTVKTIVNTNGHSIYILAHDPAADCDTLYRWDVLRQTPDPSNTAVYTVPYYGMEDPDLEALERCRELARNIGEKYGITIRVWEDALALQPWDYQFKPEYLAPILERELELLDQRLSQYPQTILEQTISHFTGLTICVVREITGTDDRVLSSATGIQFFEEQEAYVVITTGKHSEQALYHELYHVMDTHILTESTELDQWDAINPAGFSYGQENQEEFDVYLQGQTRAFVDRYSMESPREDRARILENALLAGKEQIFRSEYMQQKLSALCRAIRDAYRLKKLPETLPWEQYLVTSLAPTA